MFKQEYKEISKIKVIYCTTGDKVGVGGFKATYNVGRENRPGIRSLSPFAKLPRPPVPYIFWRLYKSAWCAGEVIGHTWKTVSNFPRVRMAQQLDLSIPLSHYSSLFFFLLCAQCETIIVPTHITTAFGARVNQMGTLFSKFTDSTGEVKMS